MKRTEVQGFNFGEMLRKKEFCKGTVRSKETKQEANRRKSVSYSKKAEKDKIHRFSNFKFNEDPQVC